mmetsp:Transcript_12388/g.25186  ORF Transcript_12388/g.25186 Transcript_12388/m.25186 type:complete len:284 (-) Transcript_12388:180-1031(-)
MMGWKSSPSALTSSVHNGFGCPGCQPETRSFITSSASQSSTSHAPASISSCSWPGFHSVTPRKNLKRPSARLESATLGRAACQPPRQRPSLLSSVAPPTSGQLCTQKREFCCSVPPSHRGEMATQPYSSMEMSPISAPVLLSSSSPELPLLPCSISSSTGSICALASADRSPPCTGPCSPKRLRSLTARAKGLRLQKRCGFATSTAPLAGTPDSRALPTSDEGSGSTAPPPAKRFVSRARSPSTSSGVLAATSSAASSSASSSSSPSSSTTSPTPASTSPPPN